MGIRQFIIISSLAVISAGFINAAPPVNWTEEFSILKRELEKRHPELYYYADSGSFSEKLDRLAASAEEYSDFSVAVKLQQVIACLGDASTSVNYMYLVKQDQILPLDLYWFEDGIYVTRCQSNAEGLIGGRLTGINKFPLEQLRDSLSTLLSGSGQGRIMDKIPRMLTWVQLLEHFGFAPEGKIELEIEQEKGEITSIPLSPGESEEVIQRLEPETLPVGWIKQRNFFHDSLFAAEGIYYLQYNRCWSREAEKLYGSGAEALFMPSYNAFEKKALQKLKSKEINKIILDLRFNEGGNSIQGSRLVKKIAKSKAAGKADFYLLIGRQTFSAAMVNAVDYIKAFHPLVIGENSGGRPNHFGEVERFVLTNSGLVISCSTAYIELLDEDPSHLKPDLCTPLTFKDYMAGKDPAFEAARKSGE